MVSAWLYSKSDASPQDENKYEPNRPVSLVELADIGVLYWSIDPTAEKQKLEGICKDRNYAYRDTIDISRDTLPNYDEKLKIFFTEHLHGSIMFNGR
jgi:1,2-dihydroxy-3-keto-5-methylthiopentene dioxygenase